MFTGSSTIRKCEKCSHSFEEFSLISGNTCGATYWTDGRMEAPMLPEEQWLVKCPNCKSLLWVDEQKISTEFDEKFNEPVPCLAPEFNDYIAKLQDDDLTGKKEIYLRMHAWWAGNCPRRYGQEIPMTNLEELNLRSLSEILTDLDDESVVMKAETHRELGEFEESKRLLNKEFNYKFMGYVSLIRGLAGQGSRVVREVTVPEQL